MGSRAVLGQAKLALRFQIPSQASLNVIVKSHRLLTSRAALLALRAEVRRSKIEDREAAVPPMTNCG